MTELDLIRGRKPDGSNGPYRVYEFQPFIPDGVNILHSGAAAVARQANHRAYFDASLFRESNGAIPLAAGEIARIAQSGFYDTDSPIRDQPNLNITTGLVDSVTTFLVEIGLTPVATLWGNPTTIATFFPSVLVDDYNHNFGEVRQGVFRIEGTSLWHKPGLALAKHRIMLRDIAGIDISNEIAFNWESVANQGGPSGPDSR